MRKLLHYLLFWLSIFCVSNNVFGQPHLVVPWGSITTPTVSHNQNFECSFTVKNIGTAATANSFAYIYIANNTSFSAPYQVSGSSLQSLAIGDSTNLFFTFSTPSASDLPAGNYYVYIVLGSTYSYYPVPFTITSLTSHSTKLPYPIIFIHGLNSNDVMWDDFTNNLDAIYGMQSGGRLNFCLNYDQDDYTATYSDDYHDFYTPGSLSVADYYTINFAVDPWNNWDTAFGSSASIYLSNQSAIYKQGRAVRDAIKHVLEITGRDKVILVGHSMGGLASREYLENNTIWQSDGKHHIAKLFTIGTPHGGSNANFTGIGALHGIDQHSEAVRDLHYYVPLVYSGVYLEGGLEPTGITDYYNDDINCNGTAGEAIVGLNQKYLPTDLSYACTIGNGSSLGGDGVVDEDRANLNIYPGVPYLTYSADTFIDSQPGTFSSYYQTHTLLPENFEINMKGLDEDNYYNNDYPYHINLNNSYYGFIQQQSMTSGYSTRDYDNYTFKVTQKGTTELKIENIITSDFKLWLADSGSTTALYSFPVPNNQNGNIDVQIQLPVGKYVLETDAAPIINGYYYPYLLKTSFAPNWPTTSYTICAGSTQNITAPAGFTSYEWALNGATISGATAPSISANTTGYYSFRATNNYGYMGPWSDSVHLTVTPFPLAGAISGASSVCVGANITLSSSVTTGTWIASNSNATVSAISGVVTGQTAGTVTISYSVTNSCGTSLPATKIITINPLANAGTITGASNVCVNASVTLSHTVTGGTWSAANSNATVSATEIVTGHIGGSDVISYSVTNACNTGHATKSMIVNPLPVAGTIAGASNVCVNGSITLSSSVAGGTWIAANSNATVNAGGIVTGHSVGTDNISYSVTNACGSSSPAIKNITINTLPVVYGITGARAICIGETITLSDPAPSGLWSSGSNNASVLDGNVTGISAGSSNISYIITNICGAVNATQQITINPSPDTPVVHQNYNLLSTTSGYSAYQWQLDGKPINGATNESYLATAIGIYMVVVTNSFGCTNSSITLTISDLNHTIDEMKIFPNPTQSLVYIQWYKKVTIRLTTTDGKAMSTVENSNEIDLSGLPNGNYLITVYDENNAKLKTQLITKLTK